MHYAVNVLDVTVGFWCAHFSSVRQNLRCAQTEEQAARAPGRGGDLMPELRTFCVICRGGLSTACLTLPSFSVLPAQAPVPSSLCPVSPGRRNPETLGLRQGSHHWLHERLTRSSQESGPHPKCVGAAGGFSRRFSAGTVCSFKAAGSLSQASFSHSG